MTAIESVAKPDAGREARQWRMDVLVGYILLYGVLLSAALVAAGLFWRWLNTGRLWIDYPLKGMNLFQLLVEEIRRVARGELRPRLLVSSGIAVLMLTPYLRVMASVLYFLAVLKNWKYTLFTSIVLAILTYSLFLR
jgi:uncharacterized membrane protein